MSELTTRTATTVNLSPKTIAATAVSSLLGLLVAIANLVQDQPALLGSLPPAVQTLVLIAVPAVVTGAATYRAQVGKVAIPEHVLAPHRDRGTVVDWPENH